MICSPVSQTPYILTQLVTIWYEIRSIIQQNKYHQPILPFAFRIQQNIENVKFSGTHNFN